MLIDCLQPDSVRLAYLFFLQYRHDLLHLYLVFPKRLLEYSLRDELDRLVEMRDQVGSGHEDVWRREEEAIQSQVAQAAHQVGPVVQIFDFQVANHFDVAGKGGGCGGQRKRKKGMRGLV